MHTIKRLLPVAAMAFAAMLHGPALAQTENVVVKRPADLRDAPGDAGRKIESLAVQTPVTRLGQRQGPWVQVRTAQGKTGWVHMFDVGAAGGATASNSSAAGGFRSITNFFSRGTQNTTTTATSTVGIRGLGEEDLAKATPNIRAVGQMEALRVDAGAARQFASGASLHARQVEELPGPVASSSSGSNKGGEQ